jgi:ketosteroid isomerase-like protein
MDMEWAQIISVRDGKMTRVDAFDDRAEALRTAGLSE